jgi:hypothetical protein
MKDPERGSPLTWMITEAVPFIPDLVTQLSEKVTELWGGRALGAMTRLKGVVTGEPPSTFMARLVSLRAMVVMLNVS